MSRNGEYTFDGGWNDAPSQGRGQPTIGSAARAQPFDDSASPPAHARAARYSGEPCMNYSPVTVKYENNHTRNSSAHGLASSPKRPLAPHSDRDDYFETHSLMKSQRGEPTHGRRVLHVQGFPPTMRARELAYHFERMGQLVRVDLPALANPSLPAYGFFEYEDPQDALAAYHDMHGFRLGSYTCHVSWANKQPPRIDVGNFSYRAETGSYSHRADEPRRRSVSPTPRGHYDYAHNDNYERLRNLDYESGFA